MSLQIKNARLVWEGNVNLQLLLETAQWAACFPCQGWAGVRGERGYRCTRRRQCGPCAAKRVLRRLAKRARENTKVLP